MNHSWTRFWVRCRSWATLIVLAGATGEGRAQYPLPGADSFGPQSGVPSIPPPTTVPLFEAPPPPSQWSVHEGLFEVPEVRARHNGHGRPGPDVPEPMVFDLVRPLGARQGELEVNVLGLVPMRRVRSRSPFFTFVTGAEEAGTKRPSFEWAPEVEYAVVDNFALEFELPMADGTVEAYKGAAQWTIGTAFNDQFIHGFQGILFIDRSNGAVTPTLLYIAAWRFDSVYSALTMIGFNHEFGGDNPLSPSQVLFNATLFADLSENWIFGLEANHAKDLDGTAAVLLMPQFHWSISELVTLQFGAGTRAQEGTFIGEGAFRLIFEF